MNRDGISTGCSLIPVYPIATAKRASKCWHQDTFSEKAAQPAVLLTIFTLGGTAQEAGDTQSHVVKTNGQFMLIRREGYE